MLPESNAFGKQTLKNQLSEPVPSIFFYDFTPRKFNFKYIPPNHSCTTCLNQFNTWSNSIKQFLNWKKYFLNKFYNIYSVKGLLNHLSEPVQPIFLMFLISFCGQINILLQLI